NHLTELLDDRSGQVYIPSTLHPSRTPGLRDVRGAPETATKGPKEVAGPQSQGLRAVASQKSAKTKSPRSRSRGLLFAYVPVIQARREATMSSNPSPTRFPRRRSIVESRPSEM